jgi:ribosomal protein S18 acetylase RimI-like enzyme
VAESDLSVVGYILWMERGGFRRESVWELEQIAVSPSHRSQGIGAQLIVRSLSEIRMKLKRRGARLKLVEVTTGSHQNAIRLYQRSLGAKVTCKIPNMYRGDEYILVARYGRRSGEGA